MRLLSLSLLLTHSLSLSLSPLGPLAIEFCGRKIHMHKSFRLVMTTRSLPFATPTLSHDTSIVNMSPSLSLNQELLLRQLWEGMVPPPTYDATVGAILEGYQRMRHCNEQLLGYFKRLNNGEVISIAVESVDGIMMELSEVCSL